MNICVVGGGLAGMITANILTRNNNRVTIYEGTDRLGGLFNYTLEPAVLSKIVKKTMSNQNIKIKLNSTIDCEAFKKIEKNYDACILSTGGVPKNLGAQFNHTNCMDVVKGYIDCKAIKKFSDKVCIIGMGNVALDVSKYLLGYSKFPYCKEALDAVKNVKEVNILSRGDIKDSKFYTSEIRKLLEMENVKINLFKGDSDAKLPYNCCIFKVLSKFRFLIEKLKKLSIKNTVKDIHYLVTRRLVFGKRIFGAKFMAIDKGDFVQEPPKKSILMQENNPITCKERLLLNALKYKTIGDKTLNLYFNADIENVTKQNEIYSVHLSGYKNPIEVGEVVSCIGFLPNKCKLNINKPVFEVGWCKVPRGNINDIVIQARNISAEIEKLKKNCHL